jgi:hypothetical protein
MSKHLDEGPAGCLSRSHRAARCPMKGVPPRRVIKESACPNVSPQGPAASVRQHYFAPEATASAAPVRLEQRRHRRARCPAQVCIAQQHRLVPAGPVRHAAVPPGMAAGDRQPQLILGRHWYATGTTQFEGKPGRYAYSRNLRPGSAFAPQRLRWEGGPLLMLRFQASTQPHKPREVSPASACRGQRYRPCPLWWRGSPAPGSINNYLARSSKSSCAAPDTRTVLLAPPIRQPLEPGRVSRPPGGRVRPFLRLLKLRLWVPHGPTPLRGPCALRPIPRAFPAAPRVAYPACHPHAH